MFWLQVLLQLGFNQLFKLTLDVQFRIYAALFFALHLIFLVNDARRFAYRRGRGPPAEVANADEARPYQEYREAQAGLADASVVGSGVASRTGRFVS